MLRLSTLELVVSADVPYHLCAYKLGKTVNEQGPKAPPVLGNIARSESPSPNCPSFHAVPFSDTRRQGIRKWLVADAPGSATAQLHMASHRELGKEASSQHGPLDAGPVETGQAPRGRHRAGARRVIETGRMAKKRLVVRTGASRTNVRQRAGRALNWAPCCFVIRDWSGSAVFGGASDGSRRARVSQLRTPPDQ